MKNLFQAQNDDLAFWSLELIWLLVKLVYISVSKNPFQSHQKPIRITAENDLVPLCVSALIKVQTC